MGLNRSSYYLPPATESEENLRLMRLIDQQFLKTPFYGSRRMTASLERSGETVNRKRVQRLMALMGLDAIFPRPRTTTAAPDARVYPYLLRDRVLTHVNEVWSSDITYVPMRHGFMYLTAVIDWFSRYVLSWRLSNTLEGQFCLEALDEALSMGRPEIFNTDQGSQFTARDYTSRLEEAGIAVSRDGRGRALDNVFVERLWRSVKYEDIYIKDYERVPELEIGPDGPTSGSTMRSVPISHSITGPQARSIGPESMGAERGKALTNAGGLSGPPIGVHYSRSIDCNFLPDWAGWSGFKGGATVWFRTHHWLPSSAICHRMEFLALPDPT